MDQLMQQLQERIGLSEEQAHQAIGVFTEFLGKYMSTDQLKAFADKVPGIGDYADKLPEGFMDKVGGLLHGFGKKP